MTRPVPSVSTPVAGRSRHRQGGSILVPLLVVAIVIVVVLMWQAGMFGSQHSGEVASPNATIESRANPATLATPPAASTPQPSAATTLPDRPLRENEKAALRAKSYQPSAERLAADTPTNASNRATEAGAIKLAAQRLIANHKPDFSPCRGATDANAILECAAKEQTRVLKAAFAEHNALRGAGDEISNEHGGAIMKQVIDALQAALAPFVEAADNS